jgi:hypothetical protein
MIRLSFLCRAKVSAVAIRPESSTTLTYEKRYRMLKRMTLSKTFDHVTDKNRYTSLKILLNRLSGHVGRRQYKLRSDLEEKCLERLKIMNLDWHDIKQLPRDELIALLGPQGLNLDHAERAVFLAATTPKLCGVLRKGVNMRHTENICMNAGLPEHGWRCGKHGHVRDVYFEGKSLLNPFALELHRRPRSLSKREDRNGVSVEVRPMPDFSISGRLTHETNPRIWSTPSNAMFDVHIIGYEFRVHPEDPRARPQIVDSALEWQTHAEAIRHVLWEMLELYAVERTQQPMNMQPYELGEPDQVSAYSAAFARRKRQRTTSSTTSSVSNDGPIEADDVIVEPVMATSSSSLEGASDGGGGDGERSWFTPPLPQAFSAQGVPECLPFAPTFMVQCTFQPLESVLEDVAKSLRADAATRTRATNQQVDDEAAVTKCLLHPVIQVSCLTHPNACYWLSEDDEAKVMKHVVSFAKRVPFAIPFNLYLRVDPSKLLRGEAGEPFRKERDLRQEEKNKWFDLSRFGEVQMAHFHANAGSGDKGVHEQYRKQEVHSTFDVTPEEDITTGAADLGDDLFYGKPTSAAGNHRRPSSPAPEDDDEFSAAARAANPPGWS